MHRVLIERFGFQNTFLITACIKAASFFPLLALLCVLREGPSPARGGKQTAAADVAGANGADADALHAPLLPSEEQEAVMRREV